MEDIREQMVQAIEQMKSNIPQSQQTLECYSLEYKLYVTIQAIEQMKSCIFQNIVSYIEESGNDFPNTEPWKSIKCGGELLSDSNGNGLINIINYCGFLVFLEQRGITSGEKVFGVPTEGIITKLDDCYVRGKFQRQAYIPCQSENAYLNAIKERSRETAQILRDIYPEELTCASVIVNAYIDNPQFVQCYLELFPEELLATLKSEKLLYYIFLEWEYDDTLHFIQSALDYDKDYFKDYKDELGNNCLFYYLARFELVQNEINLSLLPSEGIDEEETFYSKQDEIIKSLLLENGVNPDEKNIGGISYHDLIPYIEKYQIYCDYCKYFWDLYDGDEFPFPGKFGGYASYKDMTKECRELGWYKWTYKYLIYTPQSKWNPTAVEMADLLGIKVSDMKEFKELQAKIDEAKHISSQLRQLQYEENMRYQRATNTLTLIMSLSSFPPLEKVASLHVPS